MQIQKFVNCVSSVCDFQDSFIIVFSRNQMKELNLLINIRMLKHN